MKILSPSRSCATLVPLRLPLGALSHLVSSSSQNPSGYAGRLRTLNEIGRVLSATLDLHALYETIYQQIGRVMDTTQFFIALLAPEGTALDLVYHRESGSLIDVESLPYGGNVTSLAIERGTPLLFQSDSEYAAYAAANGLPNVTVGRSDSEAKIWVPLNTGNRTIGALSVQSMRRDAYTLDDIQMLSVIASQAAVAIENARLYARSQQSVRRMRALLRAAQTINASLDLPTVLDAILAGMHEVMPFYLAAILLPNHANQYLDIVGVAGPLGEERRQGIKIGFGKGITGKVFATGTPLNVPNVYEFDGFITHHLVDVHSEMAVPLMRGDSVVGVLDVERRAIGSFSPDDIDVMMLFASQAAIAIENARLFAEQQQRVFELQTIQSIVQQLTVLHDIPTVVSIINRELKQLVAYRSCQIFTVGDGARALLPVAVPGFEADRPAMQAAESIARWVAEHGEATIVADTWHDDRVSQGVESGRQAESMAAVPLISHGCVQGVIALSRLGTGQFDDASLRLVEIIAAQVVIAFERAALYERLRTEAITDPLTRLYNRRYLHERFKEERSRARRNGHNLTAIMLDIDKFKQVNDAYGHDAGDLVLRELARLVRGVVRAEDLVARHGGEEFCILLPEISLSHARHIAERIRTLVADQRMPASADTIAISVSMGVAALTDRDDDQSLFIRADRAMYEVKRRGGNGVHVLRGNTECFPGDDAGEAFG